MTLQVEAARVTASAALAAQTGNIDQAAKAVMAAAKAMQDAVSQVQEESRKNIKSKLCIIVWTEPPSVPTLCFHGDNVALTTQ